MSEITEVIIVEEPSKQLSTLVLSTGLAAQSAQSVLASFEPLLKQAEDWKAKVALIKVTDVSQTREMKLAHETRMALREIRIKAEKARKSLKEDSLRQGKAIDGAYNIVEFLIAPLEKTLLEQEQFAKNKELERKNALKQSRTEQLLPFLTGTTDLIGFVLEDMAEETFGSLLASHKLQFEAKQEAARRAEADRIAAEAARQAEQERIRKENEELRRVATEKEAALQRERAEQVKRDALAAEIRRKEDAARLRKQAELDEVARQERLKEQAAREVERQKAEAERAELKRKADEAAKAAKVLQDKLDAEAKAREEVAKKERAAARKAARAPDRDKLKAFAQTIRTQAVPTLSSPDVAPQIEQALTEVAEFIDSLAESLQ